MSVATVMCVVCRQEPSSERQVITCRCACKGRYGLCGVTTSSAVCHSCKSSIGERHLIDFTHEKYPASLVPLVTSLLDEWNAAVLRWPAHRYFTVDEVVDFVRQLYGEDSEFGPGIKNADIYRVLEEYAHREAETLPVDLVCQFCSSRTGDGCAFIPARHSGAHCDADSCCLHHLVPCCTACFDSIGDRHLFDVALERSRSISSALSARAC